MKESRIKALLKKTENEEVLFHHRKSTSTIDVRNACHPFSTKDSFEYQYVGVHNGVLRNERELRKEHEKLGIKYVSVQDNDTFNDSEALIYDLARYFEGQTDSIHAEGRVAFVVIKRDMSGKPLTLFFGHNSGSPLIMKKTEYSLTISSTGEGDMVPYATLHMYDYETGEIRTAPMSISLGYTAAPAWSQPSTTNRGGSSTGGSFKSTGKVYATWDDFAEDFKVQQYSKEQQAELLELRKQLEDDMFNMRPGSTAEIRQEILSDNNGEYYKAALTAILEAEDAAKEIQIIGSWINREDDKDTVKSLASYLQEVTIYRKLLETIADDFNMQSRTETEVAPKEELGFHQKSPANRRLLPSAVLKNNQSISK